MDFHVTCLSNNHFRFSVFSKQVGLHVYRLRRVITSTYDLYFHLWNNGTPHWEREKRAWEEEQEKEWTKVLSKRSKREAVKASKPQKRVSFAKNLADHSPPKHSPQSSICFGAFSAPIKESTNLLFGNTKIQIGGSHDRVLRPDCMQRPPCMQQPGEDYTQRPPCMQRPGEISAAVSEDSLNQRGTMALFSNSKSAVFGLFAPVAQVWAILAPIVPLVSDAGNALIGDILESIAGHVPGQIGSGNESLTAPKILLRILLPTWFGNRKSQKARKLS